MKYRVQLIVEFESKETKEKIFDSLNVGIISGEDFTEIKDTSFRKLEVEELDYKKIKLEDI